VGCNYQPSERMTDTITTPLAARRNPATLSPLRVNRSAYGPFCDAVRRLNCITPTQAEVARFVAWATLRQGFNSLAFCSLSELTQVRAHARPFAGLGKNDLSPALIALQHFGLVKMETREQLEPGVPPVTLLLVIADSSQWSVPDSGWKFSVEEENALLLHLLACRQRWTAQLPELAEEPDLLDARAAIAAEQAASQNDAGPQAACRTSAPSVRTNALDLCPTPERGRVSQCRSESQNAESPMNARAVPKVGTPPVKQLNRIKQRAVQPLNSAKADDSNRLLALLAKEFERVHGPAATAKEMANSGACWRMVARRWPDEFEQQVDALRCFLNEGGKVRRAAWFYIQHYLSRAVGCDTWAAVCEKSREPLKTL